MAFVTSDQDDLAFWDPRRPWRIAAIVVLCIAAFVPFWLVIIVLSLGAAVGEFAVVGAGVLSALAVIAALLDWRHLRRRYPSEERGSFRSFEGLAGATTVVITLGGVVLFGVWAWNVSS
jgi:membrane protein implicated in regulation of membrane protease activity